MICVHAILLAAGRGLRLETAVSKPLLKINHKPIIIYCLEILSGLAEIKDITVVANAQNLKGIIRKVKDYKIKKIKNVVLGGKRRQDSVACGLGKVDPAADLVLIHDAARPCIDAAVVSSVIKQANRSGAAIVGVPVKSTIKKTSKASKRQSIKGFLVKETLKRDNLWEIQTPQVFQRDLIFKAYKNCKNIDVTDDASLVERLGKKVSIVRGSYNNIKITTLEDLRLAEAILKSRKLSRCIS